MSGLSIGNITEIRDKLATSPRVWLDVSRVRGRLFAIEQLTRAVGAEKLIFGSLWPIQMIAPVLRPIEEAAVDAAQCAAILGGNWNRFAGETA